MCISEMVYTPLPFNINSLARVSIGIPPCSVQVRYGSRWEPRHPNDTSNSEVVEILLSEGATMATMQLYFYCHFKYKVKASSRCDHLKIALITGMITNLVLRIYVS